MRGIEPRVGGGGSRGRIEKIVLGALRVFVFWGLPVPVEETVERGRPGLAPGWHDLENEQYRGKRDGVFMQAFLLNPKV